MTTLPAASYMSNSARTEAEMKQALEDVRNVIAQQPGGATAATSTLTIATGAVTPTTGIHLIDTEAAAATDDLDTINQTNLPDGSLLLIFAANAGRTVVVKHNVGGTGKIVLVDAADLSLVGTNMSLLLKRNGTQWNEVSRSYAPNAIKSLASAATTDLGSANSNLVRITGTTTITSFGTAAAGTWRQVIFGGALTLTHNGTSLMLPGNANITTVAGDACLAVSEGSGNWRVASYMRDDGTPIVSGTVGKHKIWIPSAAMRPDTTVGPAAADVVSTTIQYYALDFDQTTIEQAHFNLAMPSSWDKGTVTFIAVWTAAAGTGDVVWRMSAAAASNDDTLAITYSAAVNSVDTLIATGDLHRSPESSALTIDGTLADNDTVFFRIRRFATDAGDTLNADARLLGIELYITTNAAVDVA